MMSKTQTFSFNLIDEAWIPCVPLDGSQPELLSLRDTLARAHTLREVYADSPLVTAALYRVCLAVLHRALNGPESMREWGEWWERRHIGWDMEKVDGYLRKHHGRFDLFGLSPFYQVDYTTSKKSDGEEKSGKAAVLLMMGIDANSAMLFNHYSAQADHALTFARAAQELAATQAFALGGGVSEVGGNFRDAPWARGIIFVAEGDTLFETLALNLMQYPNESVFTYQTSRDKPIWEMDDAFNTTRTRPLGYLDYLTWPSRRIFFIPPEAKDEVRRVRVAQGLELPRDVRGLMKRDRENPKPKPDKPPYFPLKFESGRALWRDVSTLFDRGAKGIRRPYLCDWLAELSAPGKEYLDPDHKYRLMAFGIAADQANIDFCRVERMPLPLGLLHDDDLAAKVTEATNAAEDVANKALKWALVELASGLIESKKEDGKPTKGSKVKKGEGDEESGGKVPDRVVALVNSWGAEAIYWAGLEDEFWNFVDTLTTAKGDRAKQEAALEGWYATLCETAKESLAQAVRYAGETPRALKAAVAAQEKLRFGFYRALGKKQSAATTPQEADV